MYCIVLRIQKMMEFSCFELPVLLNFHDQTGKGRGTKVIYDVAKGYSLMQKFLPCPSNTPLSGYSVFRAAPLLDFILKIVGPFSRLPSWKGQSDSSRIFKILQDNLLTTSYYKFLPQPPPVLARQVVQTCIQKWQTYTLYNIAYTKIDRIFMFETARLIEFSWPN